MTMKFFIKMMFSFFLIFSVLACSQYQTIEQTFEFDFADSDWDFQVIYSDYHDDSNNYSTYEFSHGSFLIDELDQTYKGFMVNGHNRSDDLFMGVTKQLFFQKRNHSYYLKVEIDILTNEETGSIGIGGSPADSVYLKGGFVAYEVKSTQNPTTGLFELNLNKGNQSQGGTDLVNIGTIAKPTNSTTEYAVKTVSFQTQIKTNQDGSLTLVFGSDSGFEGYTSLKILAIRIQAIPR